MNAKPKTLLYADDLAAVERRIVAALPDIVDGLIGKAREGDIKAAVYLIDRIAGRVAVAAQPPADDRRPPYTDEDFQLEDDERRDRDRLLRGLFGSGASKGA
jgi:hypothetical protein